MPEAETEPLSCQRKPAKHTSSKAPGSNDFEDRALDPKGRRGREAEDKSTG